jgi:hypothetical protein
MPRTAINYSNSCIYKIVCNDLDITECYVGSTTHFTKRKTQHKSACNTENGKKYNINVYQFIRDHGGWDNWSMLEIEKYECKDGNELKTRERYYIEQLNSRLNKNIPMRTDREWEKDNRDKILERKRLYNKKNRDMINEKNRIYRQNIMVKEQSKQYRINNREKHKEHANQKHDCECGGKYTTSNKASHLKNKLHQTFIQTI